MKKKYIWFFLAFFCLSAFFYTIFATIKLVHFFALKEQVVIESPQWTPYRLVDDHYAAKVNYIYLYQGTLYSGEDILFDPIYRNEQAIIDIIPELNAQTRKVWIDPANPKHSALQKSFPTKESVSLVILWGIFLYFIGLFYYIYRKEKR